MLPHGLKQLGSHSPDGAEGAAGALEDIAQLRAAEPAKLVRGQIRKILPPVPDISPGDAALGPQQPHGRLDEGALAAAAFAYNAQNFSGGQCEAHVPDGRLPQVGDIHMVVFQQFFHWLPPALWVRVVSDGVPQEIEDHHGKEDGNAWAEGDPGGGGHQAPGVAHHAAPLRNGGLGPQA